MIPIFQTQYLDTLNHMFAELDDRRKVTASCITPQFTT